MLKLINRCVKAPLTYIADLRAITFKEYLLISTNFSPSYPIMIFTALGFTLMYCAIIIFYVFTSHYSEICYKNVHGAAYLIAILYPIETILCFICITGSIALSKNNCWKVILMLLFGPILSGFGFGEVGIIQLCLLSGVSDVFPVPSVMKQAGFVDAFVYLYLSFLVLYFILVPSINYLFSRQNTEKDPKQKQAKVEAKEGEKQQKSCCTSFISVLYYICNGLFVVAVLFIIFVKLIGPVIFTFIWIKVGANLKDFTKPMEQFMFAGLILAYFGPLGVMFFTLAIQRLLKLGRGKKDGKFSKGEDTSRRSTWQPHDPTIEIEGSSRMSKTPKSQSNPPQPSEKGEIVLPQSKQNRKGLL